MRPIAICVLVLVFLGVLPRLLSSYYLGLAIQILIFVIFAMSLDLLVGYAGLPSLGHSAYFGTAAYTVAILSARMDIGSIWISMPAGVAVATVVAALFGLLALRTRGAYFLLVTLALAQTVWGIAIRWRSVTGADDGLRMTTVPQIGAIPWSLTSTTGFYYFALVFCIISVLLMYIIVHSPFGYAVRGVRDNESRLSALGYNTWLCKYLVFIMGGVFAGVAGVLFAYYNRFVSPDVLGFVTSAEGLLMVSLGGAGTLFGPALGAGVVVLLINLVSGYTQHWLLILGAIYVLVVLLAPKGILSTLRTRLRRSVE